MVTAINTRINNTLYLCVEVAIKVISKSGMALLFSLLMEVQFVLPEFLLERFFFIAMRLSVLLLGAKNQQLYTSYSYMKIEKEITHCKS